MLEKLVRICEHELDQNAMVIIIVNKSCCLRIGPRNRFFSV